MNARRLIISGLAGLLLFVAPLGLLAAAGASTDTSAIRPARAPIPIIVEASAEAVAEVTEQAVSQTAPNPQPIPAAPGSAERAPSRAKAPSAANSLLLLSLIASTVVLALALLVWRQVDGERLDRQPHMAQGARV